MFACAFSTGFLNCDSDYVCLHFFHRFLKSWLRLCLLALFPHVTKIVTQIKFACTFFHSPRKACRMLDTEYVCTLSAKSLKKAKRELNEDPKDRLGAVQSLREWSQRENWITSPTGRVCLTLKAPRIICSRRQFQIVPLFPNITNKAWYSHVISYLILSKIWKNVAKFVVC